jgi:urease accessory protein
LLDHNAIDAPDAKLQRAIGRLFLSVAHTKQRGTNLVDLREEGSFRIIFPKSSNQNVTAVVLNTAGGVASGDAFSVSAVADKNATLTITTQAAERIYGAPDKVAGQVDTKLRVASGARINWLPQETILFDGSRLDRTLDVEVAKDATFLMVEPLIFGREASGEAIKSGLFQDRVRIVCDGRPVYLDSIQMSGNTANTLGNAAVANGARALANVVLYSAHAAQHLDAVRDLLPETAGASMLDDNVLVIRILAADSYVLRKTLFPIMTILTNNAVPKNWRL